MARITQPVTNTLVGMLRASDGMAQAISEVSIVENYQLEPLSEEQIVAGSSRPDQSGRAALTPYPIVQVYCDKLTNLQREKFRSFSGTARVVLELSISEERAAEMERKLYLYVEAMTRVLERNRGDWGQGVSYGGNYEVQIGSIKQGGRNYLQSAKVLVDVHVSQP